MRKTRLRNEKGQFKKASKVSEFGFVNLSTYTSPEIKEVQGEDYICLLYTSPSPRDRG